MVGVMIYLTERLFGEVMVPPSKSYTHRAVILASLSEGVSRIFNPLFSRDTLATVRACKAFGVPIMEKRGEEEGEKFLEVCGSGNVETPDDVINVENSGTTLRIITAIAGLSPGATVLTGDDSIRKRPMQPLLDALQQLGVKAWSTRGNGLAPIVVEGGGFKGGNVAIRGDVSSQFITALLLVAPLGESDCKIKILGEVVSGPYVEITLEMLDLFGVKVEKKDEGFFIPAPQRYKAVDFYIPGDFSSAAFLIAAAAVTESKVKLLGLRTDSVQGDARIVNIVREMGVKISDYEDGIIVEGKGELKGVEVNCRDTPDLVPVLASLGACASGVMVLEGAEHARVKESDRIHGPAVELAKMGVKIEEKKDGMVIYGGEAEIKGGVMVESYGDHRMAMALSVAALKARYPVEIKDAECVNVSYPRFWNDLERLGVKVERKNDGGFS